MSLNPPVLPAVHLNDQHIAWALALSDKDCTCPVAIVPGTGATAVRIRLKRCPLQKFPDLDRVDARMQEPEHVAGARHDDFLRTLYALQEDPRGLFADQPVFLGNEDQRGDVDPLQQRCIVRPN